MNIYNWVELLLVPISSVVTWFATKRKRNNDAIRELQNTIDMLVSKNNELYDEIIKLRDENTDMAATIAANTKEIAELRTALDGKAGKKAPNKTNKTTKQ